MKKKVILVFPVPRAPSQGAAPLVGRVPYSLLYLARNLCPDYEVEIHDERVAAFDPEKLLKSAEDALCVGVTVFTGYQISAGLALTRKIRGRSAGVPIVWGGWHPTLEPRQTLQEPAIDYAVIGQGERTFRELLEHLQAGAGEPAGIRGLAYRSAGEIKINQARELVNPDSFPPVDFGLIDPAQYVYKTDYSERGIGIFASHGCPYHCGFCSVNKMYDRKWLPRDVERVLAELRLLKEKFGIDSVSFDDDNFFASKAHAAKLLQGFLDAKLDIKWTANAHASSFLRIADDEFLSLVKRSGCTQILIGAETGNDGILREIIGKHAAVKDTYEFVKVLKKLEIMPLLSTMVGFPYGDGTDYRDTIGMISRCKNIYRKTKAMLFFYTPYPGTPLYAYAVKSGFKPPETLEGWGDYSLTGFRAPWVPPGVRRFVRNFNCFYTYYHNSGAVFYDRNPVKVALKSVLFAIAYVRFRLNFFRFQLDAELFYGVLKLLDKFRVIDLKSMPWADY